jgi:hypothetical protein
MFKITICRTDVHQIWYGYIRHRPEVLYGWLHIFDKRAAFVTAMFFVGCKQKNGGCMKSTLSFRFGANN